jgi:hypothetical protein
MNWQEACLRLNNNGRIRRGGLYGLSSSLSDDSVIATPLAAPVRSACLSWFGLLVLGSSDGGGLGLRVVAGVGLGGDWRGGLLAPGD